MTLLAKLVAKEEGFFKAGTLPARRHNPGDLRHSPHSSHAGIGPDDIGRIGSDREGWEDLERQLDLDADRGLTLEQMVYQYAPENENDSARYLANLLAGFDEAGHGEITAETPLSSALLLNA